MAREMKDSGVQWIGEIPVDWQIMRIKYIADNNPNLDLYYFDAVSYLDNRAEDFLHNLLEGGI